MNPSLLSLHPLLRQAGEHSVRPVLPTGHAALDAALQEGGWPLGALTELLTPLPGLGELPLLAPALHLALERPGWLVLVTPPGLPHVPGWAAAGLPAARLLIVRPDNPRDWLWCVDQSARAGMPAVLAWPGRAGLTGRQLRRLQLAAGEGGGLLVVSRRPATAEQASPAALRLRIQPGAGMLALEVLKQRGGWGGQKARVALSWPASPPPPVADWGRQAEAPVLKTPLSQAPASTPTLSLVG